MSNHTDTNDRSRLAIGLTSAAAVVALVALVALSGGTAAAAEVGNETVTINNGTTDVVVETTWNDSIDDPANATASVEIVDMSDDTTAHSIEISGSESTTISREINVSDAGLEAGQEYRVTVDGPEGVLDSASIGKLGNGGFLAGATSGVKPLHAGVGLVIVILAVAAVARFTDYE